MDIKIKSTGPLLYTIEVTETERFRLGSALRHACRYCKAMGYGDEWLKSLEAMQEVIDKYDDDDEED